MQGHVGFTSSTGLHVFGRFGYLDQAEGFERLSVELHGCLE